MIEIQKKDMVGLFCNYGPKRCGYLGVAEYIGKKTAPDDIAKHGEAVGPHAQLVNGSKTGGKGKQMAFLPLNSEKLVYEQEVLWATLDSTSILLENTVHLINIGIDELREFHKFHNTSVLVAEGFIEVHIRFDGVPLPLYDFDAGFDCSDYITTHLLTALRNHMGFLKSEVNIKVHSLNTKQKEV